MSNLINVVVPDIGGAADVDVIEVLVNPGDSISAGDSIVGLESDKASMEVPSSHGGVVESVNVTVGDKVSEGDTLLTLTVVAEDGAPVSTEDEHVEKATEEVATEVPVTVDAPSSRQTIEVSIPDIGDASDVDVIEVHVGAGDTIDKDATLITLEGDKATMDIPSPEAGTIDSISIKVGEKVSQGDLILSMTVTTTTAVSPTSTPTKAPSMDTAKQPSVKEPKQVRESIQTASFASVYASPGIKRFAREYGVDLSKVSGSGRKGRITKEDVRVFIKSTLGKPQGNGLGFDLSMPSVDFSKFGEITIKPLNKIKRLTAKHMTRSWLTIPHVTQFDEADTTELEAFRQEQKKAALKQDIRLTPLAFIVKACVNALKQFPTFNASLDESGENLILKQYYNIGIAVDTPNGLVVPVIRDAENLSVLDIAKAMGEISNKARDGKLTPADMSGGTFTISSLGGISGTGFTPIVNAPEVAILGVSRSKWQPVLKGSDFIPRLMLPFSLSYDHRVIDGAEAARFTKRISECLSDIRNLLL